MTFTKIHLELILRIFFPKILTGFCCVSTFSRTDLFFEYVVCWNSFLSPEGLEKTYIHFCNNTLPVGTVTYKLLIIYGEFDLFNQIYLFNRHQKSHVTLVTILIFFE